MSILNSSRTTRAAADLLDRRSMLTGALALGGLVLIGLPEVASGRPAAKAAAKPKIVMHRSPSCGCCLKWADAARAAGFEVAVTESDDIMAVKSRLGVPDAVMSCHTSTAGNYVIEGHVPLDSVKALLRTRPKIRGIGVAGMPVGAPGMEAHGHAHSSEPIEVMAFDASGKVTPFRA